MSIIRWSTGFRLSFLQAKSCGGNWNVFGGNNQKNENWSLTPGHPICFLWMPHDSSNNPCVFRVCLLRNLMKEALFVQQSFPLRKVIPSTLISPRRAVSMIEFVLEIIQWFSPHSGCTLFFLTGACPQMTLFDDAFVTSLDSSGLLISGSRLLLRWSALSRWWQLRHFLFLLRIFGEMIQFDGHILSNGLVQPPISYPGDPRIQK